MAVCGSITNNNLLVPPCAKDISATTVAQFPKALLMGLWAVWRTYCWWEIMVGLKHPLPKEHLYYSKWGSWDKAGWGKRKESNKISHPPLIQVCFLIPGEIQFQRVMTMTTFSITDTSYCQKPHPKGMPNTIIIENYMRRLCVDLTACLLLLESLLSNTWFLTNVANISHKGCQAQWESVCGYVWA